MVPRMRDIFQLLCSDERLSVVASSTREHLKHHCCNLLCEFRRNSIPDLLVLRGSRPHEKVVVGESLESSSLPNTQTSKLRRIRVDKIMPVFCNV